MITNCQSTFYLVTSLVAVNLAMMTNNLILEWIFLDKLVQVSFALRIIR